MPPVVKMSPANEKLLEELRVLYANTSPLDVVAVPRACEIAMVKESKLYQLIADGELTSERTGRSRYVTLRSLIAYRIKNAERAGSVDRPEGGSGRPRAKRAA